MTVEGAESCGATVQHPELDLIGCELPAHGPDVSHRFTVAEGDVIEWDDVAGDGTSGAAFDVEAFVKALPEGVCLCPLCLGIGGVVEDPPFDPYTHKCATCAGVGRVRTGSLVADQAERPCTDCNGHGWVHNDSSAPPAAPARAADFAGELPPRDAMGRTPDEDGFDWTSVVRSVEPVPPAETVA